MFLFVVNCSVLVIVCCLLFVVFVGVCCVPRLFVWWFVCLLSVVRPCLLCVVWLLLVCCGLCVCLLCVV